MPTRRHPQPARLHLLWAGRTVTDFAADLGVSRGTVTRWLSGREPVPAPRRAQIAALLGAPEHDLFDTDDHEVTL